MTDDLHQACLEALQRIRWRFERQYRQQQKRQIAWDQELERGVRSPEFDAVEWNVLLDTLTASERRIVLDVVTHGYSERDEAERLGWTLSKVHRTKERALTKLRGMLNE